ncbi:four helix bundle protein [Candidatus Shapirobacteria bacterium CG09_land_8_20_14_0_10_39_12]|uniref:Four helix bundle protein n=1 Tax=Candidatus Shapirobacteria bacterium CG09_land_8_20_14_0_10_39_12 TaxID=1974885 RepID=A0A2H0WP90_9BACT|nr:MAG: four helix bundle protein [Candidatus Shapirobacteria bacterium CG09_land_8_20_14_0_10_39_12]
MENKKDELKDRSFKFSVNVIKFLLRLSKERIFWAIVDQLIRASTSIGANIIEAKAASSKKDFINFFQIALKSANETLYWLYLLKETASLDTNEIDKLINENKELSRILGASLLTMKGKRSL